MLHDSVSVVYFQFPYWDFFIFSLISSIFGGSTVYDAEGTWVEDTRVIREPVKVIEVGHRCAEPETARAFAEAIAEYAEEARQNAIAIHQTDFYIAERPALIEAFKQLKEEVP